MFNSEILSFLRNWEVCNYQIVGKHADPQLLINHKFISGSNVSAYIGMVCDTLRNSIPKAVVYCQVREAKRCLLNNFYAQVGRREVKLLNFFP